jgi:hypothetical protein
MKERAMHDKPAEIPGMISFRRYKLVYLGPGAYVGQKVIKQEQKIDVMPNNVFVTKVQLYSNIYVIGSSFLPYRTWLNDL